MKEEWKVIPGHSCYEASNLGRIKDLSSEEIKQPVMNGGFLCLNVFDDHGKRYLAKVHRLVAMAFLDDPVSWKRVGHKDGNKTNNNINNLFWVHPKSAPKREIKFIKYKDVNFEIKMFADMCKISVGELNTKLSKGWSIEDCKLGLISFKGDGFTTETHWFPTKASKYAFEKDQKEKIKQKNKQEALNLKLRRENAYSATAWELRIKEHCEANGYTFDSVVGEAYNSKVTALCSKHGLFTRKVSQILYKTFKFCPGCIENQKEVMRKIADDQMIGKFKDSSSYPEGSTFKRNLERKDSNGKYKYWDVFCVRCNSTCCAHQSDIQRGYLSCECSKLSQTEGYINLIKDGDTPICLKFGISSNSNERLRMQICKNHVHIQNIGVWCFPDKESCRTAESECKKTLTCKVIDKLIMPDGFTETTYLYNLDAIVEIYVKYGGIKYT